MKAIMQKACHVQMSREIKDYVVSLALQVTPAWTESRAYEKRMKNRFRTAYCG